MRCKASTSCPANMEKAAAGGVKKVASAADAAGGVDAVVTMLPAGKDTLAVYGGAACSRRRHPARW